MNAKTSFFNKKIFIKNVKQIIPFSLIMCIFLFFIIYADLRSLINSGYAIDYATDTGNFKITDDFVKAAINSFACNGFVMIFLVLCSFCCGFALFRYLYSQRQCKTIHALPISRDGLFVTNVLSGLFLLALPLVLTALIIGFYIMANGFSMMNVLPWLGVTLGIVLFFFSLTVFTIMLTGHIVSLPVMYVFLNFGYFIFENIIIVIIQSLLYGMSPFSYEASHSIFSPFVYLYGNFYSLDNISFSDKGIHAIIIYAIAAVVLLFVGMLLYRIRPLEMQGEPIVFRKIQPLFHYLATFLGGCVIIFFISEIFYLFDNGNPSQTSGQLLLLVLFLLGSAFSYYVVKMLLAKSIHVFKTGYTGLIAYAVVMVVAFLCLSFDIFGFEKRLPDKADISYVEVTLDSQCLVFDDEQAFDTLLECHKLAIDNKDFITDTNWEDYFYSVFSLCYHLKNDTLFTRTYYIPMTIDQSRIPDAIQDLADNMSALYNNEETLLSAVNHIRTDYELGEVFIYKTYYDENDEYPEDDSNDIYGIDPDCEAEFFQAITEDIRFGALVFGFPDLVLKDNIYSIVIDYYVPKSKNGTYMQEWRSIELAVTSECKHTLAFIQKYREDHANSMEYSIE